MGQFLSSPVGMEERVDCITDRAAKGFKVGQFLSSPVGREEGRLYN